MEINFKPIIGGIKTYTIDFPPLMTRREFDFFNKMAKKNLTWEPRNTSTGSILSGLCRCGICGGALHVTGTRKFHYYACCNRFRLRKGEKRCALPMIPKKKLERRVLYSLGELLRDDAEFDKALEMANIALRDGVASLAKLGRDEERMLKAEKQCQRKLDRLVDAIADGTIAKRDAKAKRQEIADDEADNETKKEQLARQRALLERTASQAKQISRSRQRILKQFGQAVKLIELTDEEKRDLLRSLLPPDTDCRIIVHKGDGRSKARRWYIEFSGILPVDDQNIGSAVLGGALAVP